MAHRLAFRPAARADLAEIHAWVAARAGPDVALDYVLRIHEACHSLCDFPSRGSPRDDLAPGLRTVSFERRAVIAYLVEPSAVRIVRILHHGREVRRAFGYGFGS
ncbi:MAG TPA: type II toxin-antitoxin system RelE/ParE family toxin [Allosphingosinicella sp.]